MRIRPWPLVLGLLLSGIVAAEAQAVVRGGFDAKGRLNMHGTPRFMLGVYDSGGGFSTLESHWETQIFSPTGPRGLQDFPLNLYLNYHMGAMPIDATNALLNVLDDHGMMYLQTGNCFDTGSWMRFGPGSFSIMSQAYVQAYAQHQAALGYYIMDECDDPLIPETEAHHQQLKAWDPLGITFGVNLAAGYRDPALWVDAMDVQASDPYPLYGPEPAEGYTHFIVADFISKLRAVAKPGFPIWAVLQFFKFTTDSRLPTPDEMRTHAVMSIVEGAQGIFWWDIGTNGIRKQDAATVAAYMNHLKTLTTELAGLESALLADPTPGALAGNSTEFADPIAGRMAQLEHNIDVEWLFSRIQWYQAELDALEVGDTSKSGGMLEGAAHVRTRVKVVDGIGYVFAYNYKNSATPVTFTWHRVPTSVHESKSGQVYALSGASWSDTIGPYQARIYIVGNTTPRDFHADGKADILWRNTSGTLAVWRLDGTSVTGSGSLGTVGTDWTIAGVGDFNADGKADILWRRSDGSIHVWLLNGTSVIGSGLLTSVTADWTIAAVGDVNGDGRADILWRHASGAIHVWLVNGLSIIGSGLLSSVTPDWTIAGLDDVNGDARADILWRHTSGAIHVWLLNGLSIIGSGLLSSVTPDWVIAGVGDFNGDGRTDILWRHTGGAVAGWLLDGLAVIGLGSVGSAATSWQIQ